MRPLGPQKYRVGNRALIRQIRYMQVQSVDAVYPGQQRHGYSAIFVIKTNKASCARRGARYIQRERLRTERERWQKVAKQGGGGRERARRGDAASFFFALRSRDSTRLAEQRERLQVYL